MDPEAVDDLTVRRTPAPNLQVVYNLPTLAEAREPVLQRRGVGGAKQGQHDALAPQRLLGTRDVRGE